MVPLGFGMRFALTRTWRMGIEFTYTKTFTDYIDDVSGVYYSPKTLGDQYGVEAAYFSNPAYENRHWFAPGNQRGDKDEFDAYLFLNIVFYKNLTAEPLINLGGAKKYRPGRRYKF
ncbi:unnamed protein product [Chrysoparadoxa australica]